MFSMTSMTSWGSLGEEVGHSLKLWKHLYCPMLLQAPTKTLVFQSFFAITSAKNIGSSQKKGAEPKNMPSTKAAVPAALVASLVLAASGLLASFWKGRGTLQRRDAGWKYHQGIAAICLLLLVWKLTCAGRDTAPA